MAFPKPVTPEMAIRLREAALRAEEAVVERDELIVEALREGASYRMVGAAVGLSAPRVLQIAKNYGWPDAREIRRRAKAKEARTAWRAPLEEYLRTRAEVDREGD